jgi:hypothetical protein
MQAPEPGPARAALVLVAFVLVLTGFPLAMSALREAQAGAWRPFVAIALLLAAILVVLSLMVGAA